ncbi:hypothetical protein VNI00_000609 [Paramarasmius palmivorus]|uniref:Nephrocystin 3-like N-terminal domain-containing protein n=1 Tax=Paramarasmius palmivorus TaxID=297713 RepID=A0AAW0E5S1_9AGAR
MSFNGSGKFSITGGAHNNVYGSQIVNNTGYSNSSPEDILRKLESHAAVNATCDSEARYPAPNCHPQTRVSILGSLGSWIEDTESSPTRVCWLNGSVGVGKSAIAQTISERYRSRIIGTFFFSRNDSTRDSLDPFVATIAYQCCTSEVLKDIVGPSIINIIRTNPGIFRTTHENQFCELILKPFSRAIFAQQQNLPNLIVIDGLDECTDLPFQQRLLGLIDLAITFNIFFTFLLCSRPEPQIRSGIYSAAFRCRLWCIDISGDCYQDIERFLADKFGEIRRKHWHVLRYEGESWPTPEVVWELTRRACGQFIFAATVIKYIDNLDDLPQDRLRAVLSAEPGVFVESPYPAFDMLYRQILSASPKWDKVYPILRLLITPHHPDIGHISRSPRTIATQFALKLGEVEMLLSRLHSVIHVPEDASDIRVLHASFTEFLLDKIRSREYHTPKLSRTEQLDLATVLFLRELATFTSCYPPYHPSQSFGAAYNKWKGDCLGVVNDIIPLFWPESCMELEAPSFELLAELDIFDPYSVAAIMMSGGSTLSVDWVNCLTWAKSLKGPKPLEFIERMESFLRGLHVGLYDTGTSSNEDLIIENAFRLVHFFTGGLIPALGPCYPLVLPATTEFCFPENWVVIRLAERDRESLKRIYGVYHSLGHTAQRLFNLDIHHGTSHTVHQGLVKEEDLTRFKTIFYKRGLRLNEYEEPQ